MATTSAAPDDRKVMRATSGVAFWGHRPVWPRKGGEQMKRLLGFAVVVAVAVAVAPLASATPRSGTLMVDKECSGYTGLPGSFCTFTSSNVGWAPRGTNIFYLQPETNSNDVVLDPPGPGNNKAFGHCDLPDGLNGACVFTGGTGKFTHFHATLTVTYLGGLNFHWEGTYSFSPH
jgi:hypothetical protein